MQNDLPDDELLNIPLANLQPGELRRAFAVKAVADEKKQEAATAEWRVVSTEQRSQEEARHQEHEELQRLEAALLAGLQERERKIMREAEQLDIRAIKLDDGRRAYIDGDKYRDGEGRELEGADRSQAEQHHLERPDATTWQEKQALDGKWKATEKLKQKVERLQANDIGVDAAKILTGYEAEFQKQALEKSQAQNVPDYGSGDYMGAFGGLSGGFQKAVSGQGGGNALGTTMLPVRPQNLPKSGVLTL